MKYNYVISYNDLNDSGYLLENLQNEFNNVLWMYIRDTIRNNSSFIEAGDKISFEVKFE